MADIHIRRGYKQTHVICATSEAGKKWIIENIKAIPGADMFVEVPISSEYAEEIAGLIRKDDLDVDVD